MRLDQVTAEIRPRSDWEAVDLGFALARRNFWRCISVWWLALVLPTAVMVVLLWDYPLAWLMLFWWAKPAGSRLVLFELSRRLFGEEPSWKSVLREIPKAWVRRFFYRFLWARASPWVPLTLAVGELEGLRGKPYRIRCGQILRRGGSATFLIYSISEIAAIWLGMGILALLLMLLPEGQDTAWQQAQEAWDSDFPFEIAPLILRTVAACIMLGMSLTDVFVIGAGFGIYINNRTWIEGWDVELAFKRLAHRLGQVTIVTLGFLIFSISSQAAEDPAEAIKQIKVDPVFIVHSASEWIPKKKIAPTPSGIFPGELMALLTQVFTVCVVVLILAFSAWIVWKFRHSFKQQRGVRSKNPAVSPARVVMGMAVSPDTLPPDVPTAAWALWLQGQHHEAMALLYRGSISRVIELGRVEIHESDTEGDCMQRVEQSGTVAHPDYFREITGLWIRLAYAGVSPQENEVQQLCQRWPFSERRAR
jgi:hypothetical protein